MLSALWASPFHRQNNLRVERMAQYINSRVFTIKVGIFPAPERSNTCHHPFGACAINPPVKTGYFPIRSGLLLPSSG